MSERQREGRRRSRAVLWIAAFAALLAASIVIWSANPGHDDRAAGGGLRGGASSQAEPEAIMTASDRSAELSELDVSEATADGSADIVADRGDAHQAITGFGAALTHSSASLLAALEDHARAELLEELFSPRGPVRLSALRIPIGASDFVDREAFTFDDMPDGTPDWELRRFDIAPDREAMLPVLREILAMNPEIQIMASPWSPPAWMKTNRSLEGGRLIDEDRVYSAYAAYLVRFLEDYREEGVRITSLTVQNEPQLRHPDGYPGADMPAWQQAKVIERLGPMLEAAGFDVEIYGYDHNWELHPADASTTPHGEDPGYDYPADLLRTPAASWIDGIAFHCYYGDASRQRDLWEEFPEIDIVLSECSGSASPGQAPQRVFADTLAWQADHLFIDALRNRASAVLTWNLALDEDHGPHRGGCSTCSGVVTLGRDGTVTRNAEYYLLAHLARFVPPGSHRIASDAHADGLEEVAFVTPDGDTVFIVWNDWDESREVRIRDGDRVLRIEVAGRSVATVPSPR